MDLKFTKSLSKERMKKFLVRQKWQKTGTAILALRRMALLSNKPKVNETCPGLQEKDELNHNQKEAILSLLQKQIQSKPSFTVQLKNQEEVEGSTACLCCHIEGFPDPKVIWYQDDSPIQECSRVWIEYKDNGSCSLIISNILQSDSGLYTCKAMNCLGEATSSAKLTVHPLTGVSNK
nr:PREDICTED: myosin light chain kinase, smooth muscle-like [Latimeria chalumnae]|eukprot:XP_006013915.1 PREDICTED: myosin light chain kinase, smooth muscle-like [Latimeria chalumnae]